MSAVFGYLFTVSAVFKIRELTPSTASIFIAGDVYLSGLLLQGQ